MMFSAPPDTNVLSSLSKQIDKTYSLWPFNTPLHFLDTISHIFIVLSLLHEISSFPDFVNSNTFTSPKCASITLIF